MSADLVVIGAGICGAAAAFYLQERGAEVLLLDRGGVASGRPGSARATCSSRTSTPGPSGSWRSSGETLWLELGERFPDARVTRKGALCLGHPDGSDATELEPALAPGTRALHDPDESAGRPRRPDRARWRRRVPLREGAEVTAVADGAVTLADGERLSCANVVIATGAWAGALTGLPVEPRKGQLVALAAPPGLIAHKLVEAAYLDAAAGPDAGLSIASVIEQTLDGDEVLVGSSRERVGFDATVRDDVTQAMIERAARFVPALRDLPVTRAWCGFRPWLPDGLPAIGAVGDGVWTSTGHEGSGIGLGPISGLLLAQLIAGETPAFDLSPFDPRRFDG